MNNDEFEEALRKYEAELASAEAEASAAILRVDALRKIVEGLRTLQQPVRQTERLFVPPASEPVEEPPGSNGHFGFPRGRDAVRGVLVDSRKAWKIPDLAAEIERRGWMPDVKSKRDAVAATVQRLVKDGDVERVGHGVYRYRLDKLPPLGADNELREKLEVFGPD